jgi:hypothetical protein
MDYRKLSAGPSITRAPNAITALGKSRARKSSASCHRNLIRRRGACRAEEKDHAPLAKRERGPRRQETYAASDLHFQRELSREHQVA